jgi:Raf kinase inhibitor-like YbhB/YbcL family protein
MVNKQIEKLVVSSEAFEHEGNIPSLYTSDGDAVNPPLEIEQIPEGTKTLVVIVEDPDAPGGVFDHWLTWNVAPVTKIKENSIPGISGINSAGKTGYHPPSPPSGEHRYYFHVFALDKILHIVAGEEKKALVAAMEGHILAKGTLMGRYQKINQPKKPAQ